MTSALTPERKTPSAAWWVLGGLLVVLGIVGGTIVTVKGVQDVGRTIDDYQRVSAVSGGKVTLTETGAYRLFYEAPGADESLSFPGLEIVGPSGAAVKADPETDTETYSLDGRDGRQVATFEARETGDYELRVPFGDSLEDRGQEFAVGQRSPTRGVFTIVGGVLGGLFMGGIGAVVLIVTLVRRIRARRNPIGVPPPPGAWGGPGPGAPGQGWPAGPGWTPPAGPGWAQPGGPPPSGAPGQPPGWAPPSGAPGQPPGWAPPPTAPPPGGPPPAGPSSNASSGPGAPPSGGPTGAPGPWSPAAPPSPPPETMPEGSTWAPRPDADQRHDGAS